MKPFRTGQGLLPAAFWILFALIILFFHDVSGWTYSARGYLGAVLPLLGGILAAYAVLDDPALEILFSTPVRPGRLLAERILPPLAVIAASAVTFQVFLVLAGFDLRALGGAFSLQFTWLVPTLTLTAGGAAAALAARHCAGGALAVGVVWIIQLIARDWFLTRKAAGFLMLFLGIFSPSDSRLWVNRIVLTVLASALGASAVALLKKQERYL